MKRLLRAVRRWTRLGDLRFIAGFGEFWVFTIGWSVVMLAIGACGGILVGARLLLASCFP